MLKPYDTGLIQTPYEKDFVARYPRPIDYILYGTYNGKVIGLALKPATILRGGAEAPSLT